MRFLFFLPFFIGWDSKQGNAPQVSSEGETDCDPLSIPVHQTERYDFVVEYPWNSKAKAEEDTLIRLLRAPRGIMDYCSMRTHTRTFDYEFTPYLVDTMTDKVLFNAVASLF